MFLARFTTPNLIRMSADTKVELVKSHGVDHIILYTKENTAQKVLEITNGVGVDAVYDGVRKDTYVFFLKVIL